MTAVIWRSNHADPDPITTGAAILVSVPLFPVGPKFIVAPPSIMTLRVGDDVTLVCEAISESPPMLKWEREGVPFPTGRTIIKNGKLVITAVQRDDYGVYTCIATSDDGQAKHSTTIAVLCKLNWLKLYLQLLYLQQMLLELCCLIIVLLYFFICTFQPLLANPQLLAFTLTVQQLWSSGGLGMMGVIRNSWRSGTDLSQITTTNGTDLLSSQPVARHTMFQTSSQSNRITSA